VWGTIGALFFFFVCFFFLGGFAFEFFSLLVGAPRVSPWSSSVGLKFLCIARKRDLLLFVGGLDSTFPLIGQLHYMLDKEFFPRLDSWPPYGERY